VDHEVEKLFDLGLEFDPFACHNPITSNSIVFSHKK